MCSLLGVGLALEVVCGEAFANFGRNSMMVLHFDESFQFETICGGQVRSVALDEHKERLMPHHRQRISVGSSHLAVTFSHPLARFFISKFKEKVDKCIDYLTWQGVLLLEESFEEEAAADRILHMG